MPSSFIRRAFAATALTAALGAIAPAAGLAVTGQVTEFQLPSTATSKPSSYGVVAGPDGNMWFTEHSFGGNQHDNQIARVTPQGQIIEFKGTAGTDPNGITVGPNNELWFSEPPNFVGTMTTSGVYHQLQGLGITGDPKGIAMGPDGNVYVVVADALAPKIVVVKPDGTPASFSPIPIPTAGANPQEITRGPDGNMWFTELNTDTIGRVNVAAHTITEFPIKLIADPLAKAAPRGIVAGPDGNIWFTETGGGQSERLGHISTTGTNYGETNILTGGATDPEGLTVGPDNNLWFAIANGAQIGQALTTSPALNQFKNGITANSMPRFIAAGPDGNMWFSEEAAGNVARLIVDKPTTTTTTTTGTTPPPPPPPPVDKTPPSLTKLTISPKRFYAGQKGTKITFSLSETAAVTLRFERGSAGRSVGGKCVTATHANRHRKACTRFATTGPRLDVAGKSGANTVSFTGKVAGKTLSPGTYKIAASAVDPSLNRSKSVESSSFAVVTKPKKHVSKHHR